MEYYLNSNQRLTKKYTNMFLIYIAIIRREFLIPQEFVKSVLFTFHNIVLKIAYTVKLGIYNYGCNEFTFITNKLLFFWGPK